MAFNIEWVMLSKFGHLSYDLCAYVCVCLVKNMRRYLTSDERFVIKKERSEN